MAACSRRGSTTYIPVGVDSGFRRNDNGGINTGPATFSMMLMTSVVAAFLPQPGKSWTEWQSRAQFSTIMASSFRNASSDWPVSLYASLRNQASGLSDVFELRKSRAMSLYQPPFYLPAIRHSGEGWNNNEERARWIAIPIAPVILTDLCLATPEPPALPSFMGAPTGLQDIR